MSTSTSHYWSCLAKMPNIRTVFSMALIILVIQHQEINTSTNEILTAVNRLKCVICTADDKHLHLHYTDWYNAYDIQSNMNITHY